MKRQLGAMLIAGMLLCASLAWSQSDSTGSSQGSSQGSSPSSSSSSSQGSSQGSSTSSSGSSSGSSSPTAFSSSSLFTNSTPGGGADAAQNGSGDPGQSGGGDSTQSGTIGPQDTFKHPEQLPALDLFSDQISHTGFSISTTAGSTAQRVSYTGFPSYWQALSNFGAGVSIAQSRPSLGWVVTYNGGLSLTSGGSAYSYTELNQSANAQITWNFAKRWQLRIRDSYFYSDNPFQPFFTYLGTPTPNQPNPVTYFPQAVIEQNTAHLDLTYELGPHDIVNFTAGEGFNRYLRQEVTSLYNSVSYSGGAFYQHTFTQRLAAGGGYNFASLDFGHGQSRSGVQSFEGFVTYTFNARVNASAWIGPEVTATKDIVPVFCNQFGCFVMTQHQTSLSTAEGGTLQWRLTNVDVLNVQGSRGVSNAGGLIGAATIIQIMGTYGRPLTRSWNLGIGVQYNNSNTVTPIYTGGEYLKSTTGTIGVNRKVFNDAWNLNAFYAFIHQTQNYFGFPATVSTSGLGFTIRYVWDHGLGR